MCGLSYAHRSWDGGCHFWSRFLVRASTGRACCRRWLRINSCSAPFCCSLSCCTWVCVPQNLSHTCTVVHACAGIYRRQACVYANPHTGFFERVTTKNYDFKETWYRFNSRSCPFIILLIACMTWPPFSPATVSFRSRSSRLTCLPTRSLAGCSFETNYGRCK